MLTNINTAQMLTRYNAWANQLIFEAVAKLAPEEVTKERKTLFKNMTHTLNHNYIINLIWQAHLEGREHGFTARNTKDHPPLDKLWNMQQAIDKWYISWGKQLSIETLDKEVNFKLIGGNEGTMTCSEILLHIVNHTTYHRGFIADMFYQIPAKPPTTDLPVFLRNRPLVKCEKTGK